MFYIILMLPLGYICLIVNSFAEFVLRTQLQFFSLSRHFIIEPLRIEIKGLTNILNRKPV